MKKRMKRLIWSAVVVAITAIGAYLIGSGRIFAPAGPVADPGNLPGIQTSSAPWSAEKDNLRERLEAIGLPALSQEGTVLHLHQHLDVYVDGSPVTVPPEIGIDEKGGFISPLHTHEADAIIHIESPVTRTFTLGQFFDVWGVRFTDECLGGYCNEGDKRLRVFVNGEEAVSGFREIRLSSRQQIVVAFGSEERLVSPIPSVYGFPENY